MRSHLLDACSRGLSVCFIRVSGQVVPFCFSPWKSGGSGLFVVQVPFFGSYEFRDLVLIKIS